MSVLRAVLAPAVLAMVATVAIPTAARADFTDVPPQHVFAAEIEWLAEQGITTGYPNGNGTTRFEPGAPVLREQMAAFLYRYANATATETSCGLVDVPANHAFAKQICWLIGTGVSTGYATQVGTEFRGSQPVLREQMAAFLDRLAEVESSLSTPGTAPFLDVPTGHTFAKQIAWLATTGVTTGYATPGGTEFRGSQPVLREQMAAFLHRYDGFVGWTVDAALDLVSISAASTSGGNQASLGPATSADGRYVVFSTLSSNLVDSDNNGTLDVFWRDTVTGQMKLVSRAASETGVLGNGASTVPDVSDDGRYVTFESLANNLVPGDTNSTGDIFRRDMTTGAITIESRSSAAVLANGASQQASMSADGRYVTFISYSDNLAAGDTTAAPDVFVRDIANGQTIRVGLGPGGANPNSSALSPTISADGRLVAFQSSATNLVVGDDNGQFDVFRWNRDTGITTLISDDPFDNGRHSVSSRPRISDDGEFIAYHAFDLDTASEGVDPHGDVFLWGRAGASTTLVSASPTGAPANGTSLGGSVSADGRYVSFSSDASNLVVGDIGGQADVFLYDRLTRVTTLVSANGSKVGGNAESVTGVVSPDGDRVVFQSASTNFVLLGTFATYQIYQWRREGDG
ncbi:S-layer homology domain-containing protein [Aeromicrobium sp. Sec7.5]|uniref:S-layer homology domain-containing protein n=1 Tax=Aeromicrobium sp. Sec7.5 TaxID=3121276 RepID=UPI002FE4F657